MDALRGHLEAAEAAVNAHVRTAGDRVEHATALPVVEGVSTTAERSA
ncbi:hypothetical protein [Kineococcus glutinatus]|uniref:Uncharacterized protein n=1 Tax=Kineococcus glutinatus TaxID=1070872 RepID=A0ABP9HDQ8_9ACTN